MQVSNENRMEYLKKIYPEMAKYPDILITQVDEYAKGMTMTVLTYKPAPKEEQK